MKMEEFELLSEQVNAKTISKEDGARMLMEFVYCHPSIFGLNMLDEDQLIDFLLYQYPKFINIFTIFNKTYGTFSSFLQGSVRGTYATWRKRYIRSNALNGSITTADELQYEETMQQYKLPEEEFIEKENSLIVAFCTDRKPTSAFPVFHSFDGICSTRYKDPLLEKNRIQTLQRTIILVLALKSSFYLDDVLLDKISRATGYSLNTLLKMRNTINATLVHKIQRRNACLHCRDNAYFFHRKYMAETLRLNSQTSWAKLLTEKYKKHTRTWMEKNDKLTRKEYTISATNRAVGKVLGISPRHVYYVLRQAQRYMDKILSIEYHTEYESISCNRQS